MWGKKRNESKVDVSQVNHILLAFLLSSLALTHCTVLRPCTLKLQGQDNNLYFQNFDNGGHEGHCDLAFCIAWNGQKNRVCC